MSFKIRPLGPETWEPYAALIGRHGGVWGGCWCMGFHEKGPSWGVSSEGNRAEKEALVREGRAHAALVFDAEVCVGWCQYGPPAELPRIKHRKALGAEAVPDWRITCFFVDKAARGRGVAEAALGGALGLIAAAGGGVVESMPEEAGGRKVSGSFLWNAEIGMFDRAGFARVRKLGKNSWLVRRAVSRV
jgi:ribosomal protein S18 acetylase RimI-like enzyme